MFINVVDLIRVISTTNSLILGVSYIQELVNPAWRPDRFVVKNVNYFCSLDKLAKFYQTFLPLIVL